MREPMTDSDRVKLVCLFAASAVVSIGIICATVNYVVPPIRERFQEFIEWLYPNPLSWTTGTRRMLGMETLH